VSGNEVDLDKELQKIADKLKLVKEAGHGKVIIEIADRKVVYITHSIGEQIKSR